MIRPATLIFLLVLIASHFGCAQSSPIRAGDHVIVFVPGVGGDGIGYADLRHALAGSRQPSPRVESFEWGAPMPLFMLNFNNEGIHNDAETKLARRLKEIRDAGASIDVVAHSAGGGVALGALRRADTSVRVRHVILLAPSVSPTYDLAPALAHIDGIVHVFHSDRDTTFLSWRTSNFGTYDNVKTAAAGNRGFDVPNALSARVMQHSYEQKWSDLGNDGGHFGTLSRRFAEEIVAPLLGKRIEPPVNADARRSEAEVPNFSAFIGVHRRLYRFRALTIMRGDSSFSMLPS